MDLERQQGSLKGQPKVFEVQGVLREVKGRAQKGGERFEEDGKIRKEERGGERG